MDVKERLIAYLSYKKIGQNAFERQVGIANGYISKLKGSIGSTILMKIVDNTDDLNRDWLLYGEGEMLKKQENEKIISGNSLTEKEEVEIIKIPKEIWIVVQKQIESLNNKEIQIDRLTEIISSQQQTIKDMQEETKKMAALLENRVTCADVKSVG